MKFEAKVHDKIRYELRKAGITAIKCSKTIRSGHQGKIARGGLLPLINSFKNRVASQIKIPLFMIIHPRYMSLTFLSNPFLHISCGVLEPNVDLNFNVEQS